MCVCIYIYIYMCIYILYIYRYLVCCPINFDAWECGSHWPLGPPGSDPAAAGIKDVVFQIAPAKKSAIAASGDGRGFRLVGVGNLGAHRLV